MAILKFNYTISPEEYNERIRRVIEIFREAGEEHATIEEFSAEMGTTPEERAAEIAQAVAMRDFDWREVA